MVYTMIFVNKKDTAEVLQQNLKKRGYSVAMLIGTMDPKDRDDAIDQFRRGQYNVLISTNVLARGIDVAEVDLVINFDIPTTYFHGFRDPDFATYLHRVGRTGRFGTDGLALTLYDYKEDPVEEDFMKQIEKYYQIEIKELKDIDELKKVYNEMRAVIEEKELEGKI